MARRDIRALVAHLFRRAGFGLRPDELDRFTRLGVQGAVDYLIDYEAVPNTAVDRQFAPPDLTAYSTRVDRALAADDLATTGNRAVLQHETRAAFEAIKLVIQTWWVNRMLRTTRPLQEKMTLFWHGHFATAVSKTPAVQMLHQNVIFRLLALGNFHELLTRVTEDAAMLNWLDGDQNHKGQPNENLARELMELFTLGPGHYTETDVREGARALTGWKLHLVSYQPYWVPSLHDDGVKTYLGHTGNLDQSDVLAILAAHPATGPFLARKLFTFFAYDNPSPAVVQPFAETYYTSNYSVKAMMRQILLSDAFYSEQAFQQHIKSPVEFVAGTVRELGAPVPPATMVQAMAAMGQDLFNPPNVGGWPGGLGWISANALVERYNFAGVLAGRQGATSFLDPRQLVRQSGGGPLRGSLSAFVDYLLDRFLAIDANPTTRAALLDYAGGAGILSSPLEDTRVRGLVQLLLAAPEYQL
jgi:uncharacterized protein (DUF1800 family)